MRKRCKLAKEAMKYDPNIITSEEDEPKCLSTLYLKKRRWKVAKKYIKKHVPDSRTAEITKELKWKTKYTLKKQGKEMHTLHLIRHYEECFNLSERTRLEAAFWDDHTEARYLDVIYSEKYQLEEKKG
jgi:hypothetical protein